MRPPLRHVAAPKSQPKTQTQAMPAFWPRSQAASSITSLARLLREIIIEKRPSTSIKVVRWPLPTVRWAVEVMLLAARTVGAVCAQSAGIACV